MIEYVKFMIYARESEELDGEAFIDALFSFVRSNHLTLRLVVTRSAASVDEHGRVHDDSVEVLSYGAYYSVTMLGPLPEAEEVVSWLSSKDFSGVVTRERCEFSVNGFAEDIVNSAIRVSAIMSSGLSYVLQTALLSEIVMKFYSCGTRFLPVVDDNRFVVGVITEGELIKNHVIPVKMKYLGSGPEKEMNVRKLVEEIKHNSHIIAYDVMRHDPEMIAHDASIKKAVLLMNSKKLKRLPVIGADNKLAGVISRLDIFRQIISSSSSTHEPPRKKICPAAARNDGAAVPDAGDIMAISRFVDVEFEPVAPAEKLSRVARAISASEYNFVPVVDASGKYQGIITDAELFPFAHIGTQKLSVWQRFMSAVFGSGELPPNDHSATASSVMDPDARYAVADTAHLGEVLERMLKCGLKMVVVTGPAGEYRGVISRRNIMKYLYS